MAQTGGGSSDDWYVVTWTETANPHSVDKLDVWQDTTGAGNVSSDYENAHKYRTVINVEGPYPEDKAYRLAGLVPPDVGKGIGGHTKWWVLPNPGYPFDVGIVESILGIRGKYVLTQSATAPPNEVAGPFNTKAEANNWITQHGGDLGIGNLSIPNFLGQLTSRALWIRIAEGALGVALIIVGVYALVQTELPGIKQIGQVLGNK